MKSCSLFSPCPLSKPVFSSLNGGDTNDTLTASLELRGCPARSSGCWFLSLCVMGRRPLPDAFEARARAGWWWEGVEGGQ